VHHFLSSTTDKSSRHLPSKTYAEVGFPRFFPVAHLLHETRQIIGNTYSLPGHFCTKRVVHASILINIGKKTQGKSSITFVTKPFDLGTGPQNKTRDLRTGTLVYPQTIERQ